MQMSEQEISSGATKASAPLFANQLQEQMEVDQPQLALEGSCGLDRAGPITPDTPSAPLSFTVSSSVISSFEAKLEIGSNIGSNKDDDGNSDDNSLITFPSMRSGGSAGRSGKIPKAFSYSRSRNSSPRLPYGRPPMAHAEDQLITPRLLQPVEMPQGCELVGVAFFNAGITGYQGRHTLVFIKRFKNIERQLRRFKLRPLPITSTDKAELVKLLNQFDNDRMLSRFDVHKHKLCQLPPDQ